MERRHLRYRALTARLLLAEILDNHGAARRIAIGEIGSDARTWHWVAHYAVALLGDLARDSDDPDLIVEALCDRIAAALDDLADQDAA